MSTLNSRIHYNFTLLLQNWLTEVAGGGYRLRAVLYGREVSLMVPGPTRSVI